MKDMAADYTICMDKVALGRALGFGARQAARTLMKAADAVAAPSSGNAQPPRQTRVPSTASTQREAAPRLTSRRAAQPAKAFGKAVVGPLAKYASVLWLEVTGAFFGIFAMVLGTAAWRQRGSVFPLGHGNGQDPRNFYIFLTASAFFAYFAVSSFLRARRRDRRS